VCYERTPAGSGLAAHLHSYVQNIVDSYLFLSQSARKQSPSAPRVVIPPAGRKIVLRLEKCVNLLTLLAIPSFFSVCFLMAAHTFQTMNMRLAQNEPFPDIPMPSPELIPASWRGRIRSRVRPTQRAIGIAHLRTNRPWLQPQATTALVRAADERFTRPILPSRRSVSLEVLHRALVVYGLLPRAERPEVPSFAGSLPLLA